MPDYFLVPARPMVEALGRFGNGLRIACEFGVGFRCRFVAFPFEFFGGQNPREERPSVGGQICLPLSACHDHLEIADAGPNKSYQA